MSEPTETTASVSPGAIELPVEVDVPESATRLVVFSHAWGTGLDSDNEREIARRLADRGVATLRSDMLTDAEQEIHENEMDWPLLASRLLAATEWALDREPTAGMDVGYFGTSIGAAPALRAAARSDHVDGVVTRGGRVDLAPRVLESGRVSLLMLVGSDDEPFLSINRRVNDRLGDAGDIHVLDGADHTSFTDDQMETIAERTAEFFDAV